MVVGIQQAGEKVLRGVSQPLAREEIASCAIQDLIQSMFETMRDAPGVGLAAPQVGIPLQLAVIEDRPEYLEKLSTAQLDARLRSPVPAHVIINPRLTIERSEEAAFFEGCLSLPGFTAIVPRALEVRVECLNERGEDTIIEARGWYARILQHEIDHMHGTMYIDRMFTRSFMGRENFERYWKESSVADFWKAMGRA